MISEQHLDQLERWLSERVTRPANIAVVAACGVLMHCGRPLVPKQVTMNTGSDWTIAVRDGLEVAALRLESAGGADLGQALCSAQGVLLAVKHLSPEQALASTALRRMVDDVVLDGAGAVVVEQWCEAYGFAVTDLALANSVAVPFPATLSALAYTAPIQRATNPPLRFPLLSTIGDSSPVDETLWRSAADGKEDDVPLDLSQRIASEWSVLPGVPGAEIRRYLLQDWSLVFRVRGDQGLVTGVSVAGLPAVRAVEGWRITLAGIARTSRITLLNAPAAIACADGRRLLAYRVVSDER